MAASAFFMPILRLKACSCRAAPPYRKAMAWVKMGLP